MVAHLIPSAKRGGRKREVDMREVFNGVTYVLSTGCQGRYIPKDLPAKSTLYLYFCDSRSLIGSRAVNRRSLFLDESFLVSSIKFPVLFSRELFCKPLKYRVFGRRVLSRAIPC